MGLNSNHVLMYFQVYLRLKKQILLQELPPGERLPTIYELEQELGVSLGTVRKAIELLEAEGLVVKRRGAGTFVRPDANLDLWQPTGSANQLETSLGEMVVRPISDGWVDPPRRVQALIQNQDETLENGQVYYFKHLAVHRDFDRLRNLSELFTPAWLLKRFPLEELRTMPILRVITLAPELGRGRLSQSLRPWLADAEAGELLCLPEGTPIFHRAWTYLTHQGRFVFHAEALITLNAFNMGFDISLAP